MKIPTFETSGGHRNLNYTTDPAKIKTHVYIFPGGDKIEVKDVVRSFTSRHGNHFLYCKDGTEHVLPFTWICMTFLYEDRVQEA